MTHYQDCLDALRDPRLSALRTKSRLAHLTNEQRQTAISSPGTLGAMMLFTDPPQHTRVRRLLHGFFSPESFVALRPRIDAILQDLLDALLVGVEFDFMSSLAHPLPALVIGEIPGVPHSHWKQLMNWSDIFIEYLASLRAPIELVLEAERVISEMGSFLDELAQERRSHPSDDVRPATRPVQSLTHSETRFGIRPGSSLGVLSFELPLQRSRRVDGARTVLPGTAKLVSLIGHLAQNTTAGAMRSVPPIDVQEPWRSAMILTLITQIFGEFLLSH